MSVCLGPAREVAYRSSSHVGMIYNRPRCERAVENRRLKWASDNHPCPRVKSSECMDLKVRVTGGYETAAF